MHRTRPTLRPGVTILLTGLLLAPAIGWAQQTAPAADAMQVETLQNTIRTLTAETGSLKDQLSGLQQGLAERDQRLAATDAEVGARDVRIKALETDLATARAAVAAPEAQAKALAGDLAAAKAEAEAATARAKALETDLAAARAAVATAEAQAKALAGDLATAKAEADATAAQAKALETDLAAARAETAAKVQALAAQAEAAAGKAAGLEESVRSAEAAVQQANAQLAERDGQIQTMRAELLAARNDASSFEAQLAGKAKETAALAAAGRELVADGEALAGELAALKGNADELQQELTTTQAAALYGENRNRELEGELARLTGPDTVFFTELRQALGPDSGAVIDGDRFIFPADIAFEPASARLKPKARARALEIGRVLAEAGATLPADLDWVIRIDGHTDRQSVGGRLFASNRALSAARALEVVDVLTAGRRAAGAAGPGGLRRVPAARPRRHGRGVPAQPAHRAAARGELSSEHGTPTAVGARRDGQSRWPAAVAASRPS